MKIVKIILIEILPDFTKLIAKKASNVTFKAKLIVCLVFIFILKKKLKLLKNINILN